MRYGLAIVLLLLAWGCVAMAILMWTGDVALGWLYFGLAILCFAASFKVWMDYSR